MKLDFEFACDQLNSINHSLLLELSSSASCQHILTMCIRSCTCMDTLPLNGGHLKGLFHPASLARVASWFAFVVTIFMAHENGDNKGKPRGDTCKGCWMKQTL